MTAHRRLTGGLLILLSASGYGLIPLFGTAARRDGLDETTVMALRFALASVALWTVVARRRPAVPSWRVTAAAVAVGGACWSVQSVGYLFAVTRLGASSAALLLYTYPVLVVAAAVLTGRQRWHRTLALAAALVLTGLALVFGPGLAGTGLDPGGLAAGLAAALTYAAFILASDRLVGRLDPYLFTALAMTAAAAVTGTLSSVHGGVSSASLSRAAAPLIGLALVSTVVATVAFQLGLARVGAATAAILSCWEVVVTCAVAAIALGDRLTPARIAGCAAILTTVVLLNRPAARMAAPRYPNGECGQYEESPADAFVDGAAVGYPTTKLPEDHSGCWLATDAP